MLGGAPSRVEVDVTAVASKGSDIADAGAADSGGTGPGTCHVLPSFVVTNRSLPSQFNDGAVQSLNFNT